MKNFYENMNSFDHYQDLMKDDNYQKIPESWYVVLTDIKGSTLAVTQGRFRDVNLVGSMAIVSILNKIKQSVPFVFGGDGSTVFIPPDSYQEVLTEMENCIHVSQTKFQLHLRAAIIPIKEIYALGGKIEVAKYKLSDKNYIAQFRGGGIDIAEGLAKKENSHFLLKPSNNFPNLSGLTCRWAPLDSVKGTILTLIIKSEKTKAIDKVLNNIKTLTNSKSLKELSPVKMHKLTAKWPPPIHLEAKAEAGDKPYWKVYLATFFTNLLVYLFVKFNLNTKNFSIEKYKSEIISNADYKKYDDTLRLVIDCSLEDAEKIINFLNLEESNKNIIFGHLYSKSAVMTCMVFSKENNEHIHFIDGSDGGYTLAAKELKNKIKKQKNFILQAS